MGAGRQRHPRNSQDIFNRGATEWTSAFWDKRIFIDEDDGTLHSPAGAAAPAHGHSGNHRRRDPGQGRDAGGCCSQAGRPGKP